MPNATELLHSNLHEVFSERDPKRRWAAIERTYTEDVKFIDPEATFVGRQALHDQAQLNTGFHQAMLICSALLVLSAGLSAVLVSNDVLKPKPGEPVTQPECLTNCPIGAPPLEPTERVPAPHAAERH